MNIKKVKTINMLPSLVYLHTVNYILSLL
ncbi:MAG: hypothetical protein ACP5QX_06520 [Caldisericaceae bacterium]